ncbi:MAG: SusC/RagA family TonB-linked outer membrane protein [Candidatus Cyclobacteriaceae bacterium M3_2C_046]
MQNQLQKLLLMGCKFIFYGVFLQIFFIGILWANAGNAQQNRSVKQVFINLQTKDAHLTDVFRQIEERSQFKFFYDRKIFNESMNLSLNYRNASIHEILLEISKQASLRFWQVNNTINVKKETEKMLDQEDAIEIIIQTREVSGQVIDYATSESLPGVNVVEKGTTNGTVTDIDGFYKLTVSDDATLVFSSVGYTPEEIQVNNRSVIDVQMMEDVKRLQELVVIGYGTQKKSDLTGAISSVSEEQIKTSIVTGIDQALQGRAAGVEVFQNSGQPGGGVSIRIRGANSINSSAEPLYVVDGVPISGNSEGTAIGFDWAGGGNGQTAVSALSTINPNDIVSIEILKDASATAIYGSRGANGVVLITTKRGKAGEAKISYEGYYGVQQINRKLDVMNLREYAEYQNEMADLGLIPEREEFADPSLLGPGTDWQDETFQDASIQSHQISFSGGNDNTQYAVSGGYFDQEGIVLASGFDRYSLRLNLDTQLKDWIKVGNSFTVSRTSETITLNDSDDGIITTTLLQPPSVPVRFPDGSWGGPTDNNPGVYNPVAMALDRNIDVNRTRLIGNLFAEIEFMPGLNFRSEIGGDLQYINNYAFHPTYQYGTIINNQNQSRRQFSNNYFWIFKNLLTYTRTFAQRHNLTAMIAQEAQESTWEGLQGTRKNFVTNDVQELNAGEGTTATNMGWSGSSALNSYFGRIIYNFDERYLITGTYRADGSSKFGPENRWGYFPAVALAWRISNEQFMGGIDFISNLKLRLGYGETGNQDIGNYQYGSSLVTRMSDVGNGFLLSNHPNPAIQWESSVQKNIGLDLGLFDDRIQLSVDMYDKNTEDMLLRLPLPNYMGGGSWMGIESPYVNLGEIENQGIEVALTTHNFSNDNFSWTTDLVFTRNRNKVLSLGEEGAAMFRNVQWFHTVTKTEVGQPVGQFYGYVADGVYADYEDILNSPKPKAGSSVKVDQFSGIWPGDLKFKNLDQNSTTEFRYNENDNIDQVIDANDRTYIGNPNPDFTFGFTNNLSYKNFSLTVYLQGVYGNDIYNFTRRATEGMTNVRLNQLEAVHNRAKYELMDPDGSVDDVNNIRIINPRTNTPRAIPTDPNDNDRVSSRFVEDGSYLRVKNISFGYTLPQDLTSKISSSRIRIYANIQNLFTITNYSGYDPEVGSYNQDPLLTGVDNGRYPIPRIFTVGLNADF